MRVVGCARIQSGNSMVCWWKEVHVLALAFLVSFGAGEPDVLLVQEQVLPLDSKNFLGPNEGVEGQG